MSASTPEPTLRVNADKLDRLEADVTTLKGDVTTFKDEVMRFSERLTNSPPTTQWVVQLALALIASATVTVVISSIFFALRLRVQ